MRAFPFRAPKDDPAQPQCGALNRGFLTQPKDERSLLPMKAALLMHNFIHSLSAKGRRDEPYFSPPIP